MGVAELGFALALLALAEEDTMTAFDLLFFGLIAVLSLLALVELAVIFRAERRRTRPPPDAGVRHWIQVWPPDDERTHRP